MRSESRFVPTPIRIYWIVTLTLTAMALVIVAVRRFILHEGYPYNTLFFIPEIAFSDFTIYNARFEHFGTTSFFTYPGHPFTYPAPLAMLYAFYFHCCPNPDYAFLATIIAAALIGTALMIRALRDAGLSASAASCLGFTVLLTSYPMMFLLDRGNVEIFVWMALTAGLVAVFRENHWTAALLIGLAAALKLVPGVYLLLLLRRKRYKEFVFGIVIGAVVTTVSLWTMGPTIRDAFTGTQNGLKRFAEIYVFHWNPREIGFDHSLFSLVKYVILRFYPTVRAVSADSLRYDYRIYVVSIGLLGALILWRMTRIPPLNQLLGLTSCALIFPPLSGDYTLVHLYLPLAMLMDFTIRNYARLKTGQRDMLVRLFCYFAVLLTPQSYLISHTVGFGGQVKAVVLLMLLGETLWSPLDSVESKPALAQ
jgi:hypothetical protein